MTKDNIRWYILQEYFEWFLEQTVELQDELMDCAGKKGFRHTYFLALCRDFSTKGNDIVAMLKRLFTERNMNNIIFNAPFILPSGKTLKAICFKGQLNSTQAAEVLAISRTEFWNRRHSLEELVSTSSPRKLYSAREIIKLALSDNDANLKRRLSQKRNLKRLLRIIKIMR